MTAEPCLVTMCAVPGKQQTYWNVFAWTKTGKADVLDWGTVLNTKDLIDLWGELECPVRGTDKTYKAFGGGLIAADDFTDQVYRVCAASGGVFFPAKASAGGSKWNVSELKNYNYLFLYTYDDSQIRKLSVDVLPDPEYGKCTKLQAALWEIMKQHFK